MARARIIAALVDVLNDLVVQLLLVGKVVIHRREVHVRHSRNVAKRRSVEPLLSKQLLGRVQDSRLSIGALIHTYVSIIRMNY